MALTWNNFLLFIIPWWRISEKEYVYHEAINLMDDLDADSYGESEVDDATYMEMAFDKT